MTNAADLWASGDYELLARRLAPLQDELVEALLPAKDAEWLDVATGTGEVALRAARAGARVTALDIAPALLEQARRKAAAEGLAVRFDAGDAASLPYADGAFAVVSSNLGLVFAPEHAAVARELARVTRAGAVLGFTAWRANSELAEVYAPYGPLPEGRQVFDWGGEAYVSRLLEPSFELEFRGRTWWLEGRDGEELWELWSRAAPPFRAMVERLDARARDRFRRDYVAYCERYRVDGGVRVPRPYLLVLGTRR